MPQKLLDQQHSNLSITFRPNLIFFSYVQTGVTSNGTYDKSRKYAYAKRNLLKFRVT
jgi:hypothetical protein